MPAVGLGVNWADAQSALADFPHDQPPNLFGGVLRGRALDHIAVRVVAAVEVANAGDGVHVCGVVVGVGGRRDEAVAVSVFIC